MSELARCPWIGRGGIRCDRDDGGQLDFWMEDADGRHEFSCRVCDQHREDVERLLLRQMPVLKSYLGNRDQWLALAREFDADKPSKKMTKGSE